MFCFPSSTPSTSCTRHRSPQSLGAHDAVPGRRCLAELAVHSVHHSRKQSVVASAQGPQNGDGHSSPPPDMAGLFREAQSNIMRLNQSRLKALEELKTARSRITELETRLAEAAAQSDSKSPASAVAERKSGRSNEVPAANGVLNLPAEANPPGQELRFGQEAASSGVTIAYGTGWDIAFIHYKTQTTGWTSVPGVQMGSGTGSLAGAKVATIEGTGRLEFVINNGQNAWDTPDPYGGEQRNYVVDGPGTYYLKSGRVHKLS